MVIVLALLSCLAAHAQPGVWNKLSGPYGGAFASVVTRGDSVIASSVEPYRSTDRGVTWTKLFPYTVPFTVWDSSGWVWSINWYYPPTRVQCERANDAKQQVTTFAAGVPLSNIEDILVGPSGVRLAFNNNSAKKLRDSIATCSPASTNGWKTLQANAAPYAAQSHTCTVNPQRSTFLCAGYDTACGCIPTVYRSTDDGLSWTANDFGRPDMIGRMVQQLTCTRRGTCYAYVLVHASLRSTDDGRSWTAITAGLPPGYFIGDEVDGPDSITYGIASNYSTYAGPAISRDNGVTWSVCANNGLQGIVNDHASFFAFVIHWMGDSTLILETPNGGLMRSTDAGANWVPSVDGISDCYVTSLAIDSAGTLLAGTGETGIYRSTDGGTTWERCINGIPGNPGWSITVTSRGAIIASSKMGVFRSTDHGASWNAITSGLPATPASACTSFESGTAMVVLKSGNKLYRTTDDGDHWAPAQAQIDSAAVINTTCGARGGVGCFGFNYGLLTSDDDGQTWHLQIVDPQVAVHSVAVLPNGHMFAIGGSDTNLYRSVDSGRTWNAVPTITPGNGNTFYSVRYVPGIGVIVNRYTSAITGVVMVSADEGATWRDWSRGFTIEYLLFPDFVTRGSSLFGAGYGVWQLGVPAAVRENSIVSAMTIAISPNPVRSDAVAHIAGGAAADAVVRIVDMLGRAVVSSCATGSSDIPIHLGNMPAGIYQCELISRGVRSVARFVVER